MSSSHQESIEARKRAKYSQWRRIISSRLPDLAPLSAEDQTDASEFVSDLFSQNSPSDLPLTEVYAVLDHLLTSTDSSITSNVTVPQDAVQSPQTPTLSNARVDLVHGRETPRSKRTVESVNGFSQLSCWKYLVQAHKTILGGIQSLLFKNSHLQLPASLLFDHKDDFIKVMPELQVILAAGEDSIKQNLLRVYRDPPTIPDRINASVDSQLAYFLVHLAMTSERTVKDVDVVDTNLELTKQFGRTYHGDAQRRLLEFITRLNKLDQHVLYSSGDVHPYFRGTPIVQSSGTGKTRMVIELNSATPLLFVCFRKLDADLNAKAGFPFPDKGIRKYFEDAKIAHPNLCDLQVSCFLSAWFNKIVDRLSKHSSNQDKCQALSQLNQLHTLNQQRREFFQEVSELAAHELDMSPLHLRNQPSVIAQVSSGQEPEIDKDRVFAHYLSEPILTLSKELALISQHLYPGATKTAASSIPPALVAFDECVQMNVSNTPPGNNQLSSLMRAWHYIRNFEDSRKTPQRLWLVLLSTNSSAASLIEHVSEQSSNRRRDMAALPAFVGLGFDVLAPERRSLERASDASQFKQIITYGRPLWGSLKPFGPQDFWYTASYKLKGGETLNISNPAQCYSILASRLALRLVPTHSGNSTILGEQKVFAEEVVDRNMRFITHVTKHASLHVDSPSEPALAIAASLIMVADPLTRQKKQPEAYATKDYGEILANFRNNCLLSQKVPIFRGSDGELATRLALTVAWDAVKHRALQSSQLCVHQQAIVLSEPVLLWDIIHGLADLDSDGSAILQKRVHEVQSVVARRDITADVQAWTHFTHFDVMPQAFDEITPEYLWNCWKRGVALQMDHSQPGIDGIIPVFIGDLDKRFGDGTTSEGGQEDVPYGARHMTFVAWEAKNKNSAQPSARESKAKEAHLQLLAGPLLRPPAGSIAGEGGGEGVSASDSLTQRALFCLLADLGTDTPFRSTKGGKVKVEMIKHTDCPRLCIRGLRDATTYPCLDQLNVRAIFAEVVDGLKNQKKSEDEEAIENLNKSLHPLWNEKHNPLLPLPVTMAVGDFGERGEEGMECD